MCGNEHGWRRCNQHFSAGGVGSGSLPEVLLWVLRLGLDDLMLCQAGLHAELNVSESGSIRPPSPSPICYLYSLHPHTLAAQLCNPTTHNSTVDHDGQVYLVFMMQRRPAHWASQVQARVPLKVILWPCSIYNLQQTTVDRWAQKA